MSTTVTLYEITGSSNSVKARIALGYKGLEYDRQVVELESFPGDRSSVVSLSRQPRLPVLQHGETVIFDSGAILRYLEANFPDTAPIFAEDHATLGEIEQWEVFARTQIGEVLGMMFGESFSPEPNAEVIAQANQMLNERTAAIEDKLNHGDYLVGDHLTAADIVCAAPLYLADLTQETAAEDNPTDMFFLKNLTLGEGRPKTTDWVRRVMAYDPVKGQPIAVA
jgi:glutathione S-transferase